MEYKIIKNDRQGTGYRDSSLKCIKCNGVTTRYIKIYSNVILHTIILCPTCLHGFIEEINVSILED